ncbi:MAG TPA: PaaX family transcriptional regulator C-terminal domain-containing protein [Acidimicrobiales bacterium]|jgi:phenylacetic acid degradation operon negative regulatory protein
MSSSRNNSDEDRPLTARSVLASALLGTEPPELPVGRLVAIAGLFGLSANRTRVALSRMAAAGEVDAVDGRYRLTGHLLDRQARQIQSRAAERRRWDGRWTTVVVRGGARPAAERTEARRRFTAARLAELREGVWLRPANLDVLLPLAVEAAVVRFDGAPGTDSLALAASLWDLDGWALGAERLRHRLAALAPVGDDMLAPGFVLSASVLRHFQADPLLPDELLPSDWPGPALRRQYDQWDAAYRARLVHHTR